MLTPLVRGHMNMFFPSRKHNHMHVLYPGKPTGDSESKVFIAGWLNRYSLLSMHENSRLPEGKKIFSTNHIVLHSGHSQLYLPVKEWWVNPWNSNSQPGKQAFLKTEVFRCLLYRPSLHKRTLVIISIYQKNYF